MCGFVAVEALQLERLSQAWTCVSFRENKFWGESKIRTVAKSVWKTLGAYIFSCMYTVY